MRLLDKISRFRPFAFVGDVSYSLYLWHWAVIILLSKIIQADTEPGSFKLFITLPLGVILGSLSYYFIEPVGAKFGKINDSKPKFTFIYAILTTAIVLGFAGAGYTHTDSMVGRPLAEMHTRADDQNDKCFGARGITNSSECGDVYGVENSYYDPAAPFDNGVQYLDTVCSDKEKFNDGFSDFELCILGDPQGAETVLLIGDSHISAAAPGINIAAKTAGVKLISANTTYGYKGKSECQSFRSFQENCDTYYDWLYNDELSSVDAVITAFRMDITGDPFINNTRAEGLQNAIAKVSAANKKHYIIEDDPPKDSPIAPESTLSPNSNDYELINTRKYFCSPEKCYNSIGGVPVYADDNHITVTYSKTMADLYTPVFQFDTSRNAIS